jgi:hypothetical protein
MPGTPAYRAKEINWRVDSLGRLLERYNTDSELKSIWAAAKHAGIPEEHRDPKGCPGDELPESAWFSEHVLRAFEAAFGRGGDYPKAGFRADLREVAYNLDFAAKVLVEIFSIQPTASLIPIEWLRFRAQLKGSSEAVQKTVLAGVEYPYLKDLWVPSDYSFDDYDAFGALKEIAA